MSYDDKLLCYDDIYDDVYMYIILYNACIIILKKSMRL